MRLRTYTQKPPRRLLQQVAAAYRPFGRAKPKPVEPMTYTDAGLQLDVDNDSDTTPKK